MKPPEKKWPHAKHAGQQPQRPTAHARPATHAQQFKPAVAQAKSDAPPGARPRPAAPPAYRPQSVPHVLQRKTADAPHRGTPPIGPPANRPQPAPNAAHSKSLQAPVGDRAAADRPPASEVKGPTPAYRPQPAPKRSELKGAGVLQRMRWKYLGDASWEPQDALPPGAAVPPPPPHPEDNPLIAHVRVNDIYDDKNQILRNAAGKMVMLKGGVREADAPAAAVVKPQPKKSAASGKKAEVKEVKAPLPPIINFTKGLQSVSFMFKNMMWKQVEEGTPGKDHAEVGLWRKIAEEKKWEGKAWIGFVQNGAPCRDCYRFFEGESKRQSSRVAGFVFQVTADQGNYRSESVYASVRAKKTFGIYFIGGVATPL